MLVQELPELVVRNTALDVTIVAEVYASASIARSRISELVGDVTRAVLPGAVRSTIELPNATQNKSGLGTPFKRPP